MNEPITFIVNPARTAAIIQVPLAGTGEDTASVRALATLRDRVIPETLGQVPGVLPRPSRPAPPPVPPTPPPSIGAAAGHQGGCLMDAIEFASVRRPVGAVLL
jgi:hypothetical protein